MSLFSLIDINEIGEGGKRVVMQSKNYPLLMNVLMMIVLYIYEGRADGEGSLAGCFLIRVSFSAPVYRWMVLKRLSIGCTDNWQAFFIVSVRKCDCNTYRWPSIAIKSSIIVDSDYY